MPAFILPYALLLVLGFGGGFYLSHTLDNLRYDELKAAVERANNEASFQIAQAEKQALESARKSYELNRELDQSHDSFINTANALHDRLTSARLRDTGSRQSCVNAVPNTGVSFQPEAETANAAELSADFDQLLKSEAYRADQLAAYAETCYRFIQEQGGVHAGQN